MTAMRDDTRARAVTVAAWLDRCGARCAGVERHGRTADGQPVLSLVVELPPALTDEVALTALEPHLPTLGRWRWLHERDQAAGAAAAGRR